MKSISILILIFLSFNAFGDTKIKILGESVKDNLISTRMNSPLYGKNTLEITAGAGVYDQKSLVVTSGVANQAGYTLPELERLLLIAATNDQLSVEIITGAVEDNEHRAAKYITIYTSVNKK